MGREITRAEAAVLAGVAPDTFSGYVARGQAPSPTRRVSRTPVWDEDEVRAWVDSRPGQGSRLSGRAMRRAAERAASTEEGQE